MGGRPLLLLLLFAFSLCSASVPLGVRLLSAYCTPIDVFAATEEQPRVLLAQGLQCGQKTERFIFNATCTHLDASVPTYRLLAIAITAVLTSNNATIAHYGTPSSVDRCS